MLKKESEFSTLITLWDSYFPGSWSSAFTSQYHDRSPDSKRWSLRSQGCPCHPTAMPQCSRAALLCSMSGDQSSSPAEGFEAQQALFRSSQGLLKAGGNQMTANGSRRAWPGDKVKGCNNLHPDLGAVQQLDVLDHQVNYSEPTPQAFCLHHLQQSLGFC